MQEQQINLCIRTHMTQSSFLSKTLHRAADMIKICPQLPDMFRWESSFSYLSERDSPYLHTTLSAHTPGVKTCEWRYVSLNNCPDVEILLGKLWWRGGILWYSVSVFPLRERLSGSLLLFPSPPVVTRRSPMRRSPLPKHGGAHQVTNSSISLMELIF